MNEVWLPTESTRKLWDVRHEMISAVPRLYICIHLDLVGILCLPRAKLAFHLPFRGSIACDCIAAQH